MSIRFTAWKPTASVRDRELERSVQRSHAAKVVNRRKRLQLAPDACDDPSNPAAVIPPEIAPKVENQDWKSDNSSSPRLSADAPIPVPTTILKRGNSDPFDSFVISVTPIFNRIIVFARESYFPSVTIPRWLRSKGAKQARVSDGHAFIFGLASTDSAIAHVSTYAACLSRILPYESRNEVEDTCLQVRTRALETLRVLIAQLSKDTPASISVVQQVVYLFQGATEARDFKAAKVHARMLQHLLLPLPYNTTTIFLFLTTMHTMLEVATFTSQSTVVDFDHWHYSQWKKVWLHSESLLPPYSLEDAHPCISSTVLQGCLLRLRKWLTMTTSSRSSDTTPDKSQSDLINLWSHTRPVKDCADLLKHFLNLPNFPPLARLDRAHESNMTLEAALTLALFCIIRKYVHCAPLDDTYIDLRDASYVLAPRLREVVEAFLAGTTREERDEHSEALFWIYFNGAIFEQSPCIYRSQLLEHGLIKEEWWFSWRLAEQAKLLELQDWNRARQLLDRFAFSDILDPHPKSWWNNIFGTLQE